MQSAAPFQAAYDSAPKQSRVDINDVVEECFQRTAGALQEARAATSVEISKAIARARESWAAGHPSDLIEVMARIQGNDEEHLSRAILELGDKVAATLNPSPPLIPFAGKLIAPSAFYESFEQLHKLSRALLSPVIYAEDTDAIGTASVNPVNASIMAEEIGSTVLRRFAIRPFVTHVRLDYESWTFLSRKHFEL